MSTWNWLLNSRAYRNKSNYDTFPLISVGVTKSKFSMKHCLTSDQSNRRETLSTNTKLSTTWNLALIKMEKFEYKALFVVTHIVMPQHKYRQLTTKIHFKDNDLTSESKHDCGFKIKPLTDMMSLLFNNLEVLRNTCLEMRWLSNPIAITASISSCMVNQKCEAVNYGLLVVQVGTASLKRMADIAIVTALFMYRQIQVTDTRGFCSSSMLHKHPVSKESRQDDLLPLCASHITVRAWC